MRESTHKRIVRIVKQKNPNLIFITDDVYATFVPGFRSLMADLPQNVIGVYSFSKNFGCTGWRIGVVAVHQNNIFDRSIAAQPARARATLNNRYGTISLTPEKIKFIDRMVADSRSVALNHTAGLSLPQQVQMTLFSLSALLDHEKAYDKRTREICQKRLQDLWNGIDLPMPEDALRAGYYAELDLQVWAEREYGQEFFAWLKKNYEPVDVLFRLAEQTSVVLMDGGGFAGPAWSVRVSLANLPDEAYPKIGEYLRAVGETYAKEWKKSQG
jgi:aspartate 4-decarboxylase